ncbi:Uncharacterised protein [Mycobacteroides abscessus subsp. abscessus]|nr:Uncharacterised protein [Mycobacteroides abscessus subsp. abscessus]SIK19204.1 Uncharacterised protein [Mycobacteroides abscessus subsp. abscessus]
MSHRHPLGGAGGTRGEDDPCVVAGRRFGGPPPTRRSGSANQSVGSDHGGHLCLAEHQRGALVGVVGIDGHVGGARCQGREDRHIQRVAARRHPDTDAVTTPDAAGAEPFDARFHVDDQLRIGELNGAVVDGRRIGILRGGGVEDVDQSPRRGRRPTEQILRGYRVRRGLLGDGLSRVLRRRIRCLLVRAAHG